MTNFDDHSTLVATSSQLADFDEFIRMLEKVTHLARSSPFVAGQSLDASYDILAL